MPQRIAFLTFTRAAKYEALLRTQLPESELPYLKTVHACSYHALKITKSRIMTPKMLHAFGEDHNLKISGRQYDPWVEEVFGKLFSAPGDGDYLVRAHHLMRQRCVTVQEAYREVPVDNKMNLFFLRWFNDTYTKWKQKEGLLDYTDLLEEYLQRGEPLDVDAVFIDEAQDLSLLQWRVVAKMYSRARRIYMAGDDDQAIFSWAGADPRRFMEITTTSVEYLRQSYRLPSQIQTLALKVARRISKRVEKDFLPRDAVGTLQPIHYLHEVVKHLVKEESFVLFRNYTRGVQLGEDLTQLGVPFTGFGSPLDHPTVQAALTGWQDLINKNRLNRAQMSALDESLAVNWRCPAWNDLKKRFVGDQEWVSCKPADVLNYKAVSLEMWDRALKRLPWYNYVVSAWELTNHDWRSLLMPRTALLSIHQVKGREAENVVLDLEMTRRTYNEYQSKPDDEHRVFYVGVTRARERLFYLLASKEQSYELL